MSNRYAQVLATYVRRPFSSFTAGMIVGCGLIMAAFSLATPKGIMAGNFPILMFALAEISIPMWLHFRDQIVRMEHHLLPRFLLPHLIPFIAVALLLSAVIPEIIALGAGIHSVGLPVLSIALFALLGWWTLTLSPWLMVAGILIIDGLAFSSSLREIGTTFITGQHETLALWLLAGSILTAAIPLIWICRLTEDHALYQKRVQFDSHGARDRMTGEASQSWQTQQSQRFTRLRLRTQPIIPAGTSLWSRSRRWSNIHSGAGYTSILVPTGVLLLVFCAVQFWFQPQGAAEIVPPIMIFIFFALPLLHIPQAWLRQWRFLEADSLRPMERPRFLKELALAMGSHFAIASLISSIYLVAMFLLKLMPHDSIRLIQLLVQMIFIQIFAYGVSLWLMRYRSPGRLLIAMPLICIAIGLLLTPLMQPLPRWQLQVLIASICLGLLGIFIARDAYARWLTTELG